MTWVILQKHNLHEHLVAEVSGPSGSFVPEEHCDNCSYELCLSAQGQGELIDQKCIPVPPNSTQYTFASKPPGASIAYVDEDKEVLAPYVAQPIVGSRQTISANVISNGRTFVRWSDGVRDPVRTFVTGTEPKTFRAIYANRPPVVSVKSIPLRIASPAARARTIKLHAKGSRDPEGEPLRFSWKFSDGRSVRGSSITRTFKRVGSYGVTLTVRDRIGGAAVYRGTVKVGGARPALRRIRSRATVKAYDEEPQE